MPRTDNAYHILTNPVSPYTTVSSFNCILTSYAEQGDVRKTFNLFEAMGNFDVEPDLASYSCLFEALAIHLKFLMIEDLQQGQTEDPGGHTNR
jgi:pentatricopeptide repeat protein